MSATDILENIVPISSFNRGQSSKNFKKAQEGPVLVIKNNEPEAVIVNTKEYVRLIGIEEDYFLLLASLERLTSPESPLVSQDDLLVDLGISADEIESAEETEIE